MFEARKERKRKLVSALDIPLRPPHITRMNERDDKLEMVETVPIGIGSLRYVIVNLGLAALPVAALWALLYGVRAVCGG